MPQPKIKLVPFYNPTDKEIELLVSVTPGNLDQAFTFPPKRATKGPEGYTKFFKRNGLVPGEGPGKKADPKTDPKDKGKGKDKD
jgi:hypothetical protein